MYHFQKVLKQSRVTRDGYALSVYIGLASVLSGDREMRNGHIFYVDT